MSKMIVMCRSRPKSMLWWCLLACSLLQILHLIEALRCDIWPVFASNTLLLQLIRQIRNEFRSCLWSAIFHLLWLVDCIKHRSSSVNIAYLLTFPVYQQHTHTHVIFNGFYYIGDLIMSDSIWFSIRKCNYFVVAKMLWHFPYLFFGWNYTSANKPQQKLSLAFNNKKMLQSGRFCVSNNTNLRRQKLNENVLNDTKKQIL